MLHTLHINSKNGNLTQSLSISLPAHPTEWDDFFKAARRAAIKGVAQLEPGLNLIFSRGKVEVQIESPHHTSTFHNVYHGFAHHFGFNLMSELVIDKEDSDNVPDSEATDEPDSSHIETVN